MRTLAATIVLTASALVACGGEHHGAPVAQTAATPGQPDATGICVSREVALRVSFAGAASGSARDLAVVTNTSPSSCRVRGYAGLVFTNQDRTVPVRVNHIRAALFPAVPVTTVVLRPRSSASFFIGFADSGPHGGACRLRITDIVVTLPGDQAPLRAHLPQHELTHPCTRAAVSQPFIAGATAKGWN